ncbi:hypothetical protein D3C77_141650 [compost metagenome]
MTVADHHVFFTGQAFQADRAAGMQFVGGNTDFRAQTILETVGKAGRGVDHHRGRIDLGHELASLRLMFGHDGIGMVRAIVIDMFDGLVQAVDHANRQNRREVFSVPVRLGRRHRLDNLEGALATAQFDTFFPKLTGHFRQELGRYRLIDQQGFHRPADAVAVGLGVEGDAPGLVQLCMLGHIDVADAVQVLDHRHPRVAADALDQALAATRHDDIDKLRHADQRADRFAIGGFHHLYHRRRQAGLGQPALDAGGNGTVGVDGLGAATQDGGVAGLEAQAGGVDGHVRPGFVDDPDHAQRYAHLADLNTRRPIAHVTDRTDRVWKAGDLAQTDDHAVDTGRGQRQALEHGRFQAIGTTSGQVQLVGSRQLVASGIQGIGGRLQRAVFLRGAGTGNNARGLTGGATQAGHVVKNGLSHGLSGLGEGENRMIITVAWSHAQR